MNTSPIQKLSYDRSFDDIANRKKLVFRLHSPTLCWTFFHPREKVLVASLHTQELKEESTTEELSRRLTALTALEEVPSSLEESEAVVKHITSWCNEDKEPSRYISLTFNVLCVLWLWKRRISSPKLEGRKDDFEIIVLNSSELRAGSRVEMGTQLVSIAAGNQAEMGTQLESSKKRKLALDFARPHDEVIVAKCIRSEAILGSMQLSELEAFIPPWCRNGKLLETTKPKLTFEQSLPPDVDKVDCARVRESLRFSLALLAPMLVPDGQQRNNNDSGKEEDGTKERSSTEDKSVMVEPTCGRASDSETALASGLAEVGESQLPTWYRKRSCSPEMGGPLAGTTGKSLEQEPLAKRRKLSEPEEEQTTRGLENDNVTSSGSDAERDGQACQASMEPLEWECQCVVALATDICCVKEEWRKKCQILLAVHGRELLSRYRTARQQRDLGLGAEPRKPLETLCKIMDDYKGWNEIHKES